MRADVLGEQSGDVVTPIRAAYKGVLVGNMGYTPESGAQAIADGSLRCHRLRHVVSRQSRFAAAHRTRRPAQRPEPIDFLFLRSRGIHRLPGTRVGAVLAPWGNVIMPESSRLISECSPRFSTRPISAFRCR